VPWFLWDRNVPARELRRILSDPSDPRRIPLLGVLLREERPDRVWAWVSPQEVSLALDAVSPFLGRQRDFWRWLIGRWRAHGLVA
jgi:hypothetical protein